MSVHISSSESILGGTGDRAHCDSAHLLVYRNVHKPYPDAVHQPLREWDEPRVVVFKRGHVFQRSRRGRRRSTGAREPGRVAGPGES